MYSSTNNLTHSTVKLVKLHQDNHINCVFECSFQPSLSISDSYLSSPFREQSQITCINVGYHRGKDNGKPSSERPKGGHSRLIEVAD